MEVKRKKLGVIFNFSKTWLGGIYYVVNVVKTLNYLEDKDKPEVYLFYDPANEEFLEEFNYPYLKSIPFAYKSLAKGYLKSIFSGKNTFVIDLINSYNLDGIYPVRDQPVPADKPAHKGVKLVSWYADLQHRYYPEFFSRKQRLLREARIGSMVRNARHLVVSSNSVGNDFKKFYKLNKKLKLHVYHFTSIIDDFKFDNHPELLKKYQLPSKYFLISNQFHRHKNHKVLMEALAKLKEKKELNDVHFAITGRFPSEDNSPYIKELYNILNENALHDHVTFLGVIPREDQLCLMRYAQAVIQPSLFEGWSTVIEDAISLQTPVIASNLDVNIEQLKDKGIYFEPLSSEQLVEILKEYPERREMDKILYEPYEVRVSREAYNLLNIVF